MILYSASHAIDSMHVINYLETSIFLDVGPHGKGVKVVGWLQVLVGIGWPVKDQERICKA